jgi:hypothetical protein
MKINLYRNKLMNQMMILNLRKGVEPNNKKKSCKGNHSKKNKKITKKRVEIKRALNILFLRKEIKF